jgi:rhamnosyltransferase
MEKVLVVLASFNGERFIEEQIRSILNQIDVNISIYIFDDKSFDNTVSIVNKIDDPRISVFVNKINSGSPALNFINSIKSLDDNLLVNFDYISLSDQDDIWLPNKTIKAIELIENNNAHFYASNLTIWNSLYNSSKLLQKDHKQVKYDYLFEGASAGCTYVISTEAISEFKKDMSYIDFSEWSYLSHDWLLYFYARSRNKKVIIDSNSYIFYRIHDNNVHGQLNTNSINSILKRFNFVLNGWYFKQIEGFSKLLNPDTIEFNIYRLYTKNIFTRCWILINYNFELMRSQRKFLIFFLISLIPKIDKRSFFK